MVNRVIPDGVEQDDVNHEDLSVIQMRKIGEKFRIRDKRERPGRGLKIESVSLTPVIMFLGD